MGPKKPKNKVYDIKDKCNKIKMLSYENNNNSTLHSLAIFSNYVVSLLVLQIENTQNYISPGTTELSKLVFIH